MQLMAVGGVQVPEAASPRDLRCSWEAWVATVGVTDENKHSMIEIRREEEFSVLLQ